MYTIYLFIYLFIYLTFSVVSDYIALNCKKIVSYEAETRGREAAAASFNVPVFAWSDGGKGRNSVFKCIAGVYKV